MSKYFQCFDIVFDVRRLKDLTQELLQMRSVCSVFYMFNWTSIEQTVPAVEKCRLKYFKVNCLNCGCNNYLLISNTTSYSPLCHKQHTDSEFPSPLAKRRLGNRKCSRNCLNGIVTIPVFKFRLTICIVTLPRIVLITLSEVSLAQFYFYTHCLFTVSWNKKLEVEVLYSSPCNFRNSSKMHSAEN